MESIPHPPSFRRWLVIGAGFAWLALAGLAGSYLPDGIDWRLTFRPAALALLAGQSPYTSPILQAPFANPPWALLALLPFSWLPVETGRGVWLGLSLVGFALAAIRLGAKPYATAAFLLSPPVLHCLLNANLDWLPLLGFSLPPVFGLFLVSVKPQMGMVIAVFWLVEAWRQGGWRQVLKVFGPFSAVLALSLAVFGLWPLNFISVSQDTTFWEASLWPTSIPVGLALAAAALRLRKPDYAMAASPCLSPHVVFHSWSAALIPLVSAPVELFAAVVGLWVLIILRAV